jgi:hypothetical protein
VSAALIRHLCFRTGFHLGSQCLTGNDRAETSNRRLGSLQRSAGISILDNPTLRSLLDRIFTKLGCALVFAGWLTITTKGTFGEGLRYVAALGLLISFSLFGAAIVRQRSFVQLSEWDEGFAFSFLAASAHFGALLF